MASILEINSDSSDSENDCDYVPSEDDVSDLSVEENDGENEVTSTQSGNVPRKRTGRRRGSEKNCTSNLDEEEEVHPVLNQEAEKEHAENLWADFLQDVKPPPQKEKCSSSVGNSHSSDRNQSQTLKLPEEKAKKVTISEVYEFAGESVVVTKEVDECSKEAENHKKTVTSTVEEAKNTVQEEQSNDNEHTSENRIKTSVPAKRGSGLSSVIGSITNKKQKLSTLEKSLIDWKSFTKEEGLQEDLEHHKRSKGSYLENQAFLQRSDLRLFEIEKTVRMGNKSNR